MASNFITHILFDSDRIVYFLLVVLLSVALQSCEITMKPNGDMSITPRHFTLNTTDSDLLLVGQIYTEKRYTYTPSEATIATFCRNPLFRQIEPNLFRVSTLFDSFNIVNQETNSDCWLTCILMVVKHERLRIDQSLFKKSLIDLFRDEKEMQAELSIANYYSRFNKYSTYSRPIETHPLISSIAQNHPVIVGFKNTNNDSGHVRLLIGLEYSFIDNLDTRFIYNMKIQNAILVDPGQPSRLLTMNGDKFAEESTFAIYSKRFLDLGY